MTFINKVDREGLDPLELLDEIASVLALDVTPVTWPIGMGVSFRAGVDVLENRLLLPEDGQVFGRTIQLEAVGDAATHAEVDQDIARRSMEGLELASSALPKFDLQSFHEGHLTPVFFGKRVAQLLRGGVA